MLTDAEKDELVLVLDEFIQKHNGDETRFPVSDVHSVLMADAVEAVWNALESVSI